MIPILHSISLCYLNVIIRISIHLCKIYKNYISICLKIYNF